MIYWGKILYTLLKNDFSNFIDGHDASMNGDDIVGDDRISSYMLSECLSCTSHALLNPHINSRGGTLVTVGAYRKEH